MLKKLYDWTLAKAMSPQLFPHPHRPDDDPDDFGPAP